MLIQDIIARKRDGLKLDRSEIEFFIDSYTSGALPDYQAAALIMAIFIRGLDSEELSYFANAMLHSGTVVDLSHIQGIKVDKHSTGGVGDKISIPLAPLVAACGVKVPMVSGRGLGHTGGTLDKLESIPGFSVRLPLDEYARIVEKVGVCMIGQTEELAPADRKIYSLRDATACVPSIPLIASSIMSKKLAEGIDALVLDVKVGTGAFMPTEEKAEQLARTLVEIGRRAGKKVTAFLTRMDDPLGVAVGNACEVIESIEVLRGGGPEDIRELTLLMASHMLVMGGVCPDPAAARERCLVALGDGSAIKKFKELISAQGGNPEAVDHVELFAQAAHRTMVRATRSGIVQSVNSTAIGMAGVVLGAGRRQVSDPVDPAVSLFIRKKIGDTVAAGEVLVDVHYNDDRGLTDALERLQGAYVIDDAPVARKPLVLKTIQS
ncbi:thymidine phosphorylase [Myxococcota bacterium]|nr:thymidine phosphorylase [Myxococcota bacterium]